MPVTTPGLAASLLASLASFTLTGTSTPQLSQGIASGVTSWLPSVSVTTVDTGTLGTGIGNTLLVPPPTLLPQMITAFPANGILGVSAPLLASAIASGLSAGLLPGVVSSTHLTVGAGVAVASFAPSPATPFILAGLTSAGLSGTSLPQLSSAIGSALTLSFASHVMTYPIVGAGSSTASGGVGSGTIFLKDWGRERKRLVWNP